MQPYRNMLTGGAPMVMPVIGALIVSGIDPTPLLREVEIDSRRMFSPSERFADESIQALWLRAPDYAGRPDVGLRAAQLYRPGMRESRPLLGAGMAANATQLDT